MEWNFVNFVAEMKNWEAQGFITKGHATRQGIDIIVKDAYAEEVEKRLDKMFDMCYDTDNSSTSYKVEGTVFNFLWWGYDY